MVKAFDSNDLSHLQLSNPFGGKSSNLLGVDIFLVLTALSWLISVEQERGVCFAGREAGGVVAGW